MTPLETLQKYGLKTDVKSIIDRIDKARGELDRAVSRAYLDRLEIYRADLALLCDLAEKGERYEKAVGMEIDAHAKLAETTYTKNGKERFALGQVVGVLSKIRDYAKGEPK